jgi:sulfonate transport system substrate-binding protein
MKVCTLWSLGLLLTFSIGCSSQSPRKEEVLRIGYQKWSTFSILKASGELAQVFEPQGVRLEWIEFPSGPPLLEALNAGSLDIGHCGDSPPLFAQAAGIPFVYFGASSSSPKSSAILVKSEAPIHRAVDLKGKRVGFAKGTSAHTLVLRYLEKSGLKLSDIVPVYLSPADGRVALESGSIDAWSIWDPYYAATEHSGGYRTLTNGVDLVEGREFYLASRQYAESKPARLQEFLSELKRVKKWAKERPDEVNHFLSLQTGIPIEAVALAEARRNRYETQALTEDILASQQALADRYLEIGLLPQKIDVRQAVFSDTKPEKK